MVTLQGKPTSEEIILNVRHLRQQMNHTLIWRRNNIGSIREAMMRIRTAEVLGLADDGRGFILTG